MGDPESSRTKGNRLVQFTLLIFVFIVNVAVGSVIPRLDASTFDGTPSFVGPIIQLQQGQLSIGSDTYMLVNSKENLTHDHLISAAAAGKKIYVNSTNTVISNIRVSNVLLSGDEVKRMKKRDWISTDGPYVYYTQTQAAQGGYWWSPWYPVSCCYDCGNGPTLCTSTVAYAFQYYWSITEGSSISFGDVSITSSIAVGELYTETASFSCTWLSEQLFAQIWYQQFVYWADMQEQDCSTYNGLPLGCGAWSQYYRANAPTQNAQVGCSAGYSAVDCASGLQQICAIDGG